VQGPGFIPQPFSVLLFSVLFFNISSIVLRLTNPLVILMIKTEIHDRRRSYVPRPAIMAPKG
jgi:hypothetical protein